MARFVNERSNIMRPLLSWDRPLADKSWRRFFDALQDAGVSRMAESPVRFGATQDLGPTFDPAAGQSSALFDVTGEGDEQIIAPHRQSRQINAPTMEAIYAATGQPVPRRRR
jgi:hypothetical protein